MNILSLVFIFLIGLSCITFVCGSRDNDTAFGAIEIEFNNYGTRLHVVFSEQVDITASGLVLNTFTTCTNLFDSVSNSLLGNSECGFDTINGNDTLIIQLASDASIIPNNDELTLLSSVFISQETATPNSGSTLTVDEPENFPNTTLIISHPTQSRVFVCCFFFSLI